MNLAIWKRLIHSPYGVALGLCLLLDGLFIAAANPLLPIVISDRIGLDKGQVTIFYLLAILVSTVVTLATGYLSDGLIARYKLVLGGGLLAALGYLGIATATLPVHAFLAGVALVMLGVMFPQLFAAARIGLMGDWAREDQMVGMTALRTLFSLGYIFGTALATWMARVMDIQAMYFIIAAGAVVLTVFATAVLYKTEGHITRRTADLAQSPAGRPPARTESVMLPLYALAVPLIAVILMQGAESTRGVYLSLVTFQLFKDASIAPAMFGMTATAELITMSLLGSLASRIGAKYTIALGGLVGGLTFMLMTFSQSLPLLYASQVLYAVFVAALEGVAMVYVQGLLGERAGMGSSLYMAVMNVGSLVGILSPLLVVGYNQTVFIIPVLLCLMGALLIALGDRTTQIEQRLKAAAPVDTTRLA